jgi:hypothetical protein
MRDAPSAREYITKVLASDRKVKSVDAAVELALGFRRDWASFHVPRYLRVLDAIQKEVLRRLGLPPGDLHGLCCGSRKFFSAIRGREPR